MTTRLRAALVCVAGAALALTGCASSAGGPMNTPTPRVEPSQIRTPTPPAPLPPVPSLSPGFVEGEGSAAPVPDDRLDAIRADLEQRGVPTEDLIVASSEAVTWRDGSLGCPREGMAYTQSLVPGMRVVVRVDGREFDYRFGSDAVARLCEQG